MKILGISSHYHDASAALIIDGEIVASAAEERFSREKHDPAFPHSSIMFCLNSAGLKKEDIDYVAYHEDPIAKFSRNLSSGLYRWPFSLKTFVNSMKDSIVSGLWVKNEISKSLNIHPKKIAYISHHLGHASHSFLTSPFDSAAVVTLDAAGEWTSTAIFDCVKNENESKIEPIKTVAFPSSIGLVYSAFTVFLGFKANSSEGSTMALAAFGKPTYADQIRKILKVCPKNLFEVDLDYFDFSKIDSLPITDKFLKVFGEPRNYKDRLPFDCFTEISKVEITNNEQRYADIAASIQLVTEEVILHVVKIAKNLTNAENLCLAGGVALNCVSNGKLILESGFKNIYCPPDPGDGGGALGAAIYLASIKEKINNKIELTPLLGENLDLSDFENLVKYLDPTKWHKYSKLPLASISHGKIKLKKYEDTDEMIHATAKIIADNKIVGWVQGRFENGPRALGARSILINPRNVEIAKKLSRNVKLRAAFRPYACSFTEKSAIDILNIEGSAVPLMAKWMLCAIKVKEDKIGLIRAAIHVDGTTRPQVVYKNENETYYKLLIEIGKITGVEAVLNTSFNESGHPIINTAVEALLSFARTDMDALVVGNIIIERGI